ncbi:hypothetical protein CDAR_457691 [Caerostris darwini]|uniref:Uncharacterized protein n=1 Tax=Caerostris darwini TaxID=1538125 RepID=A0AAV4N6X7_9ARAC|nr:hypothetical protein CDAR_457691 [Caerostris darwini]
MVIYRRSVPVCRELESWNQHWNRVATILHRHLHLNLFFITPIYQQISNTIKEDIFALHIHTNQRRKKRRSHHHIMKTAGLGANTRNELQQERMTENDTALGPGIKTEKKEEES